METVNKRWSSNTFYSGDIFQGLRHGMGSYYKNSKLVYKGQWSYDNIHGLGTRYYSNGMAYTGEFYENKRHGFGRLYKIIPSETGQQDELKYVGSWRNNKYHGHGHLRQKHIFIYGVFINGNIISCRAVNSLTGENLYEVNNISDCMLQGC